MSASIAHRNPHAQVVALWARLEVSTVAMMAVGMVLCARPLLDASAPGGPEGALAATANAFAAFMMGELLCMPFGAWLGETRRRRLVRPVAAAVGAVAIVAGMAATGAVARVVWYGLAGFGTEAAQAWFMGEAVRSPLVRRRPELIGLVATCAAVIVLELALYLALSGPPQGVRTFVVCCAGQATVILLAVLYTLYPPPESSYPIA